MDKYQQYKHLLEYFTTHLEYVQNDGDTNLPGYNSIGIPIPQHCKCFKEFAIKMRSMESSLSAKVDEIEKKG